MTSTSWASSPGVRANMQANRSRDTQPEMALRRELHKRGRRYYVNRALLAGLRRTADIVFPRARLAVFVDGCFWHGCPAHHTVAKANAEFWSHKVDSNRRRDRDTDRRLEEAGWHVLRIWEHVPAGEAADAVEALLRILADAEEAH